MRTNTIVERLTIPTYPPAGPVVIASRAPDLRVMRLFNPLISALLRSPLHGLLRNLRGGTPVAVLIRGQTLSGRADIIEEPAAVAVEVERLITQLGPEQASRQLYMALDLVPPPTREQLGQALKGVVIVRITPEETKYV